MSEVEYVPSPQGSEAEDPADGWRLYTPKASDASALGLKYSWDMCWRRTGRMLFLLHKRADEVGYLTSSYNLPSGKERQRAALADVSKMSVDEVAEELDFLPPLDPSLSVWTAAATLEEGMSTGQRASGSSGRGVMKRCLQKVLKGHMLWAAFFYSLGMVCSLAIPLCSYGLLKWTEAKNPSQYVGFGYVFGMFVSNALSALCKELYVDRCNFMGLWTMSAACGLV